MFAAAAAVAAACLHHHIYIALVKFLRAPDEIQKNVRLSLPAAAGFYDTPPIKSTFTDRHSDISRAQVKSNQILGTQNERERRKQEGGETAESLEFRRVLTKPLRT